MVPVVARPQEKSSPPEGKIKLASESLSPRRGTLGSPRHNRDASGRQTPMASTTAARQTSASTINPDLSALKIRQQAAWASGNYAVVGTTLQIVGEQLCETLDLRAGAKVLDVAAGNGMVTLAAARRLCDVTSTDYVPTLLEQGRARASAEGLAIGFMEADA